MKLYAFPLSGHSHRARLFLSLVGIEAEIVDVDLKGGEHKSEPFLKLNSFGQVPVLDDEGTIVSDSNAILVYVAKKLGRTDWLPEDALGAARVQRWLSVAAGQIASGPASARLITVFGATLDPADVIAKAHKILALIEEELASTPFITGRQPTIADVALYSYVSSAPEGNVDLSSYANILAWLRRIEALPGFVPFQKTAAGLHAAA